ncbi:hypothetical protein BKA62DRAFT_672556 [Auriculariales sp. MPI-PUGE-AT-0066]|nr:hypothetical protein BKA62DRAFT_672556 [Auriculariales sp. MPI-PUGE-AT-0066]
MSILTSGPYFFSQEKIPISPPNQPGEEMVVPLENPTDPLPPVMKPNVHGSQWNVETLDENEAMVIFKLLTQDRQYLAVNQDGSKNPPITTSTDPENAAVIIAH